ncbi:TPA: D-glycero-beta-D-manno-heptose-7-phosphate kinase [Candidatus Delongbacteria bacterium]|nr:D-glycero-beta-D-manno-heptose-7-phosphate kinase [Candidatus Delongbacteria bacterium]
MVKISSAEFAKFQNNMKKVRIAVIGDVMLDIYYWGRTERISPEAPVPVVNVTDEEIKPGGAANVGLNIKSLGAVPVMFGIIGSDLYGLNFIDNLTEHRINVENIIVDKKRPTTVKTRILASNQHVVRFDKESSADIDKKTEQKLLSQIEKKLATTDAVIFEDYNKGMLTPNVIKSVIKMAEERKIMTAVDPKIKNFQCYKGVTLFKPNLRETEEILKRRIKTESEIEKAGIDLMDKLELKNLVITLSDRGMAVFDENAIMSIIPARSTRIANVSGAGDTVIATLVSYMCAGASFEEACTIANYAASIVVEDVSIIPVDPKQLYERLTDSNVINGK